jgi:hypothetical protein
MAPRAVPWRTAGDVNGDGFADVIIGAKGAEPTGGADPGTAYVVYGTRDARTVPTISIDDVSVNEGSAGTVQATFTVRLSGAGSQPVTVQYASANGTAIEPSDYTAVQLGYPQLRSR